jgi:glutathione synthase
MSIRHLFIIDPFEKLNIDFDTSLLIINECFQRGHEVFVSMEHDISFVSGKLFTKTLKVAGKLSSENLLVEKSVSFENMELFDFVHIRKDPPYNENYHILLLVLRHLKKARVLNSPESLISFNEKELILHFPELITDTIISSDYETIYSFLKDVGGKCVLKPLFECSGKGITLLDINDKDLKEKVFVSTLNSTRKVMVQKFLKSIYKGETRVFMLLDKPLAVMKKIPKENNFLANFDFGAKGIKHNLSKNELKLCLKIGNFCRQREIVFYALDIIDEKISEINITSPGLLVETNNVYGASYEKTIVDYLESECLKGEIK